MSILLLGANGQVGYELQRALSSNSTVVALDYPDIDFTQPETLRSVVRRTKPNVIINAAAYTAVDKAESDSQRAFLVNSTSPGVLAEEADLLDAVLIHYSTDYVFDGRKASPYVETDPTCPLSVYGQSKLEGESLVQACRKHLIFRTSWVIGAHGHNFIKTMLKLAGERDSLRVVADQHGAPTAASLLAGATFHALSVLRDRDERWGLYHLVASGETTWHGLACHAIERARSMGVPLKATAESVTPIGTSDYPTPAARPANSRLSTAKFRTAFGMGIPDWTVGINDAIDRIVAEGQR